MLGRSGNYIVRGAMLSLLLLLLTALPRTVNGGCSGTTTELTAQYEVSSRLTTDNYPSPYLSDQDCTWKLTAADSSHNVIIYIQDFYTERNYDYLYVYDGDSVSGTLLWSQAGSYGGEWILSSSEYMYLRFTSDYSQQRRGFAIKYMSVDRGPTAASYTCGDTFSATTGYSQLSVLEQYDTDQVSACGYTITSAGGTKIQFSLQLEELSPMTVYEGSDTSGSIVAVYDVGYDTTTYQSTTNSIYVEKANNADFVMVYQQVSSSATVATAPPSTTTERTHETCSGTEYLTANYNPEILSTPNYPDTYPNNLYCVVTITAADTSNSVAFTFNDIQLSYCCDFIKIFDGYSMSYSSLGISWQTGSNVTSSGSALTILFYSDGSSSLRGAQAQYYQVARAIPSCVPSNYTSLTATTSEQVLTSPNYPNDYNNNEAIYWLITKPQENKKIVLNIREIDIEYSSDCVYDKLTIYDGPCTSSPVLLYVCGNNDAIAGDDTGLYILVEFTTDYSVVDSGFELVYYIGEYEEDDDEEVDIGTILRYTIPAVIIRVAFIGFCIISGACRKCMEKFKCFKTGTSHSRIRPSTTNKMIELAPPFKSSSGSKLANGGETNVVIAVPPAKHSKPKRLTTHQLLEELRSKYGSKESDGKLKASSKQIRTYAPQPGSSEVPHYGPLPYGPDTSDPVYPPNFFAGSANEATTVPHPKMVPRSELPSKSLQTVSAIPHGSTSIPGPSTYLTPSEARQAGNNLSVNA